MNLFKIRTTIADVFQLSAKAIVYIPFPGKRLEILTVQLRTNFKTNAMKFAVFGGIDCMSED